MKMHIQFAKMTRKRQMMISALFFIMMFSIVPLLNANDLGISNGFGFAMVSAQTEPPSTYAELRDDSLKIFQKIKLNVSDILSSGVSGIVRTLDNGSIVNVSDSYIISFIVDYLPDIMEEEKEVKEDQIKSSDIKNLQYQYDTATASTIGIQEDAKEGSNRGTATAGGAEQLKPIENFDLEDSMVRYESEDRDHRPFAMLSYLDGSFDAREIHLEQTQTKVEGTRFSSIVFPAQLFAEVYREAEGVIIDEVESDLDIRTGRGGVTPHYITITNMQPVEIPTGSDLDAVIDGDEQLSLDRYFDNQSRRKEPLIIGGEDLEDDDRTRAPENKLSVIPSPQFSINTVIKSDESFNILSKSMKEIEALGWEEDLEKGIDFLKGLPDKVGEDMEKLKKNIDKKGAEIKSHAERSLTHFLNKMETADTEYAQKVEELTIEFEQFTQKEHLPLPEEMNPEDFFKHMKNFGEKAGKPIEHLMGATNGKMPFNGLEMDLRNPFDFGGLPEFPFDNPLGSLLPENIPSLLDGIFPEIPEELKTAGIIIVVILVLLVIAYLIYKWRGRGREREAPERKESTDILEMIPQYKMGKTIGEKIG